MHRRNHANCPAVGRRARLNSCTKLARALALAGVAALVLTAAEPPAPDPDPGQAPAPGAAKPAAAPPAAAAKKPKEYGAVGVGIIGGGQLRDWFQTAKNPQAALEDKSGRFMIGATVHFNLSPRFMIELDAMRRGFGVKSTTSLLGVGFSSDSSGTSWEFPCLFKWHIATHNVVRPFVGFGGSVRHVSQSSKVTATASSASTTDSQGSNTLGIPLAAGADFRLRMFRISPELRYTLWTADKSFTPVRVSGLFDSLPNQVAFLVAFTIN